MNKIIQDPKYNQFKQLRKNSENINSKVKYCQKASKNIIIQRKMTNILTPNSISNERRNKPFYFPLKENNPTEILSCQNKKKISNNNIYEDLIHNNTTIEEKILMQRPQIKIKMHSLKHNNINRNTISLEKSNNKIKCKVHKITPNTTKNKNLNISDSNKKGYNYKNKINYNIINISKDNFNLTQFNNEQKNKEKTYINYYNYLQEKSLKNLSDHLDDKNKNNNFENINKEKEKEKNNINCNKINGCKTNIYRKKIKRRKNCCKENNYTNLTDNLLISEQKNNINDINKQATVCDHNDILIKNRLKLKRAHKFIYKRNNYQNPNQMNYLSNNCNSGNFNFSQNNSILMTSLSHKINNNSNIITNYPSEIRKKGNFLKLENIQNHQLIFNNNKPKSKSNTFNFIEIKKQDNKENYSSQRQNFTDLRYKKNYNLGTPKLSNIIINPNNIDEYSKTKYDNTFNLNYYLGNSDINNYGINKNFITLYSNTTSEYNTVNTLNNSEKNIIKYPNNEIDEINSKFKNSMMNIKNSKFPFQNNLSQKKINIKEDLKKNIINKNSKNKKLKNVITSIEYPNRNNKKSNNNLKDKNIILSEVDQYGKINIRVREMKNSIEKIMRENSFNKAKNIVCLPSPQKISQLLTYVKKNQGTQIRKIKKHNTINNIDIYPPPIPFQ